MAPGSPYRDLTWSDWNMSPKGEPFSLVAFSIAARWSPASMSSARCCVWCKEGRTRWPIGHSRGAYVSGVRLPARTAGRGMVAEQGRSRRQGRTDRPREFINLYTFGFDILLRGLNHLDCRHVGGATLWGRYRRPGPQFPGSRRQVPLRYEAEPSSLHRLHPEWPNPCRQPVLRR